MAQILVLEDNQSQNDVLTSFLRKDGHEVVSAFSLAQGQDYLKDDFDLVILDLNFPDGHGFDFLRAFRELSTAPVIILTAIGEEIIQLNAFDLKADEYVEKPFSPLVMTKRVRALLDRVAPESASVMIAGHKFDFDKQSVYDSNGSPITLTLKELQIVKYLYDKKDTPVLRTQMIEELWGFEYKDEIRLLDTHIKNIRKKISPSLIKTIKNFGYCLKT